MPPWHVLVHYSDSGSSSSWRTGQLWNISYELSLERTASNSGEETSIKQSEFTLSGEPAHFPFRQVYEEHQTAHSNLEQLLADFQVC